MYLHRHALKRLSSSCNLAQRWTSQRGAQALHFTACYACPDSKHHPVNNPLPFCPPPPRWTADKPSCWSLQVGEINVKNTEKSKAFRKKKISLQYCNKIQVKLTWTYVLGTTLQQLLVDDLKLPAKVRRWLANALAVSHCPQWSPLGCLIRFGNGRGKIAWFQVLWLQLYHFLL